MTVFFVAIKLWEEPDKIFGSGCHNAMSGLEFTWSFGVGLMASALFVPFVFLIRQRRLPRTADLGCRRDVLAGMASGAIWGIANAGIDLAIDNGVALGTANSIFQSSIVVSGIWGIWYRELEGTEAIVVFGLASVVFLSGLFLEAAYGGEAGSGSD